MKKHFSLLILLFIAVAKLQAQTADKLIAQGNIYFRQQQYPEAEDQFRKALNIEPKNNKALLNLATTLYKQKKNDEAKTIFNAVSKEDNDASRRSAAYYNYGVMMTNEKKLEESIEAYKNALRQNPDDNDARENLQKALMELKKKNQNKKQDEKKKQNQDQQQKPQSKLSQKEAEQKLKLLEQKEKEAQQRLQKAKSQNGNSQPKDW